MRLDHLAEGYERVTDKAADNMIKDFLENNAAETKLKQNYLRRSRKVLNVGFRKFCGARD